MNQQTLPNTDVVDHDFLTEATTREGPWVSIYLPTHRTGREVLGARAQYNNLLKLAAEQLQQRGDDGADELLAAAHELGAEQSFWQHQSDGLAVFVAPGFIRALRLPMDLPDEVSVADRPRLQPIAPLLSGSGVFYVLALSTHSVRLFEGTRASIGELDLGDTPRSTDDLEGDGDSQAYLQSSPQSRGGGEANFHGHGEDSRINEIATERLFRAVSAGIDDVLGRTPTGPLVLAAVSEHWGTFSSVNGHRQLLDEMIAGNPDQKSATDLHAEAVPIVGKLVEARKAEQRERFGSLLGTGKASDQPDKVAQAALEGRVDTLILAPEPTRPDGQAEIVEDPADAIIIDVLRNSGHIVVIDEDGAAPIRATFRY